MKSKEVQQTLFRYFELPENYLSNRQAIEFYKHDQNSSNRLIAGGIQYTSLCNPLEASAFFRGIVKYFNGGIWLSYTS
jgi:hypothetical protein